MTYWQYSSQNRITLILVLVLGVFGFGCSPNSSISSPSQSGAEIDLPTLAATAGLPSDGTPQSQAQQTLNDLPATNTPVVTATNPNQPLSFTPTPTATGTQTSLAAAPATLIGFPTEIPPTATPRATRVPNITPTLRPDDPVFQGTSINDLTERLYGTGTFTVTRRIGSTKDFTRYAFIHESDEELVSGFFNIPITDDDLDSSDAAGLPVALVLHGYIPPEEYELLDYTARYADNLAQAGFVTFHPSYRGHPPRDNNSPPVNVFRIEYAVDVLNLIEHIQQESLDPESVLYKADSKRVHMMGHSMGGGIAQRVMTVRPKVVRSVVLYAPMSGDEARNYEKIKEWGEGREWRTEFFAPAEVIETVSPINFIDRWEAPVEIHHGSKDDIVPPEWSEELCTILEAKNHPVTCYLYQNYPHNFYGSADQLFITRMISFFQANSG